MKRWVVSGGLLVIVAPYLVLGGGRVVIEKVAGIPAGDRWNGTQFRTDLTGAEEVPPVDTETTGSFQIRFNEDLSAAQFRLLVLNGIAITQAHLHCAPFGVNGPVVVFLSGNVPGGFDRHGILNSATMTDANIAAVNADCTASIGRDINTLADLADAAADGLIYANVHSVANPGGVIRGQLVHDDEDGDDGDDNENDNEDDGGDGDHDHGG